MHEWLAAITSGTVLVIDAMVLVIIAIGTIQAFVEGLQDMLLPSVTGLGKGRPSGALGNSDMPRAAKQKPPLGDLVSRRGGDTTDAL